MLAIWQSCLTECRARLDLGFVIDGSGNYGRRNFRRSLKLVQNVVRRFTISNYYTRIGVVVFASRPRLVFRFGQLKSRNKVLNRIARIR